MWTRVGWIAGMVFAVVVMPVLADEGEEPPGPVASAVVRAILDEAARLRGEQDAEGALGAAERALALAREKDDDAGVGFAHGERALALEVLGRSDDAITAWRETASAWESQGIGPERLEALGAQAILAVRVRDFGTVERAIDEAVELARREEERPLTGASILNATSEQLWRAGQLVAATELGRAALEITERAANSLAVAVSLSNLGIIATLQGDLDLARSYHSRALEIREKQSPNSMNVSVSLNNLGTVALRKGDLKAASGYYLRATEIREQREPGTIGVARSLGNVGAVFLHRGDLRAASEYFLRALEIVEKRAPGSVELGGLLNNLGIVKMNQGDLAAALDYLQRALGIKEHHAPGSLDVALTANNLGMVAFDQGNVEAAHGYYHSALQIRERQAPGSLDVAASLNNLGIVATDMGDFEAARDYHRRALGIQRSHAPGSLDVAASLANLGVLAGTLRDFEDSREYHQSALQIEEREAPGSLRVALSLTNLGFASRKLGDYETARECHRRALEIQEKLAPGSLAVARSLNNLGTLAKVEGDLEAALRHYRRALDLRERHAPRSLAVACSLHDMGDLSCRNGDHEAGRAHYAKAWSIVRSKASVVAEDEARLAYSDKHAFYAADLISAEIQLGHPERALVVLEESRAQGLLELFERRGLEQSATPKLWLAFKNAERRRDQLGEKLAGSSSRIALLERDLSDLEEQGMTGEELAPAREQLSTAQALRAEVLAEFTEARVEVQARLAEIRRSVPGLERAVVSDEAARKVLSPTTVFFAFSVGDTATTVIVVPSDSQAAVRGYVVDLTSEQLAKRVDFVRDRLGVGRVERGLALAEKKRLENASRLLFRKLFPEAVRPVLEKAERVVISPDGPLWNLPFAALDAGADDDGSPRWLGLDKSLSYAPSLTTLVHAKRRAVSPEKSSILVIGDPMPGPDDEKKSNGRKKTGERTRLFPGGVPPDPLPGAREEAKRLAKLYECEPLIGLDATESVVRTRIPQATIMHLATHGYFHPTHPMSSGVLLAPAKDESATGTDADGALQAWEILSSLDLQADLVVLSACETGLGRAVRGEGLVGLTRALQAAGANSVVATHWKVADDSTTELMVSFHEKLRAGVRKDDALRQAMRKIADGKETSHPYFWAAFFLSGGSE